MVPMRIFRSRHALDIVDIQTGECIPAIWQEFVKGDAFFSVIRNVWYSVHTQLQDLEWTTKYCYVRFRTITGRLVNLATISFYVIVYMPILFPPTHLPANFTWSSIIITRHLHNCTQRGSHYSNFGAVQISLILWIQCIWKLQYKHWYVEIKCQLDATEVFVADLIACSTCFGHHYTHHQELNTIIKWLLPVVFGAVKM